MAWLLVSFIGLIIVVLSIRYYHKENENIDNRKKRGLFFILELILTIASESYLIYLGLLLILFGLVKATGLL